MGCGKSTAKASAPADKASAPADSQVASPTPPATVDGENPNLLNGKTQCEVTKEEALTEQQTEPVPQGDALNEQEPQQSQELEAIPEEPNREAAAKAEEDKAVREFTIVLDKSTGLELGVDVDLRDGRTLVMANLQGGLLEKWNVDNPKKMAKQGDLIIEVNGIRDDVDQLVAECKQNKILAMTVRRLPQKEVAAQKTTQEERVLSMGEDEEKPEALRNISVLPQEEKPKCGDVWCCA